MAFFRRLIGPRPDFAFTMSEAAHAPMVASGAGLRYEILPMTTAPRGVAQS